MAPALSLLIALLAPTPDVVVGPDVASEAQALDAPIRRVTVYGDQARVTREAAVPPGRGVIALRLPDLPGAVGLDSLRVEAPGARVLRVEANPVERSRASIDQVEEHLRRLEQLTLALATLDGEVAVLAGEAALLERLTPAAPVAEHERPGAAPLALDAWRAVQAFVEARALAADQRRLALATERKGVLEQQRRVEAELAEINQAAFSARRVQVVVVLDRQADGARLALSYATPGAGWTPVYRIERSVAGDRLTLSTAGLVSQATGEDWVDAAITLSTATPGRAVALPKLLTWTLGEQRDFEPRPMPATQDAPDRLPPPESRVTRGEDEEQRAIALLRRRLDRAGREAGVDQDADGIPDRSDACPGLPGSPGESGCPEAAWDKQTSAPPPPPPPEPMPAMAPARDEVAAEDSDDREYEESEAMAESAQMARGRRAPPAPVSLIGGSLGAGPGGPRPVALDLFDERVIGRGPFGPPGSPAALAGGLDHEYPAATPMTLPSQPEAQRVPLAVETWPITPFYTVTPGLKETAYLKAVVKNQGGRPVLGGPVNIFVGTDFIGQGRLETTGPGGELDLPLGADEDLRVTRRVIARTVTEGVFSKDEVTTYRTVIEVANDKRRPVQIRVLDQVPVTNDQDVKIAVGALTPKPMEGPDKDGLVVFQLDLPAGQVGKVELVYTLTRPAGHQLRQR